MTETYEYVLQKKHRAFRKEVTEDFAAEFSAGKLPLAERIVRRFERLAAAEEPHILPGDRVSAHHGQGGRRDDRRGVGGVPRKQR